jgi:two-component sensor histidine kinase
MVQEIKVQDPKNELTPFEYGKGFREGKIGRYKADFKIIASNGDEKWLSDCAIPIKDPETGTVIGSQGILQDISERKQTEERIQHSLEEKEVLLKEIHHRVKNNMQVISSMLNLQSTYVKDEEVVFRESQNRVRSMALIHEKLYQSDDLAKIDISKYIHNLVSFLCDSYCVSPNAVTMKIDVEDILLGIDAAIPCGLILNELVSNALKHAFPGDKKGEILVVMHTRDGLCTLSIADDGVGLPKGLDVRNTESLGLQLVDSLVQQLNGEMVLVSRERGAEFVLTFPDQN